MGPPTLARRAPHRRRATPAVALAAALIVPLLATGPSAPAAAQTPDEVVDAVAALDGGTLDPATAARLAALLAAADPAVLPPGGLADVDPARVRTAVQAWADVAPEWRTVGLELAQRAAECRDGLTTEGCGDELRAQLWLRHAEELRRTLEGRFGAAADLSDDERVRLEGELLRARDRAMERLRLLEDCDAEQLRRLEQSCEQLQERLRDHIDELGRLGPAGREGRP